MTVNNFREELNHVTAGVVATIEEYHKMDPGGVVIDRPTLLRHIDQQVTQNGYVVESNPINFVAGLGPLFCKTPREIRDMIFGKLLASGHPQFLRASMIMNQEGTSLISKHGVYRINIGFGSIANCPKITQQGADNVQNLHLRVHMMHYESFSLVFGRYPEGDILKMFNNSNIARSSCSVCFEGRNSNNDLIALDVISCLLSFKGFEEVSLSIDSAWFGGILCPDFWHARQMNEACKNRHVSLDTACRHLELELGTAYRVQKEECAQLVFHPRCSGQGKVKDYSGKEKCKWVQWEDEKE